MSLDKVVAWKTKMLNDLVNLNEKINNHHDQTEEHPELIEEWEARFDMIEELVQMDPNWLVDDPRFKEYVEAQTITVS